MVKQKRQERYILTTEINKNIIWLGLSITNEIITRSSVTFTIKANCVRLHYAGPGAKLQFVVAMACLVRRMSIAIIGLTNNNNKLPFVSEVITHMNVSLDGDVAQYDSAFQGHN